MSTLHINFVQFFSLLSLLCILALGFIVIAKGQRLVNKLFFVLTIILDIWTIGTLMMFFSSGDQQIIFWDRFVYIGVVFWPAVQYHFSLAVTYFDRARRVKMLLGYCLSIIFLLLTQSEYFVSGIFRYRWGVHTNAQILHHIFVAFFFIYSLLFFWNLFKQYHLNNSPIVRKKLIFFAVGFAVLDFIGGSGYLPAYGVAFYPVSLASPLIFSIIITYAIAYLGLLNIKLILRRYFVYSFTSASVIIPAFVWQLFFYKFFPKYTMISYLIIFVLSISIVSNIKKYFFRLSNKYFFSSLYDVREVISSLNSSLRSSLEIKKILPAVGEILSRAFHSEKIGVINYNSGKNLWSVLYNSGFQFEDSKKISLSYEVLAGFLSDGNRPVVVSKIKEGPLQQFSAVVDFLEKLDVVVVVPITIKGKLTSLLLFGPKESGDSYNREDLKVLEAVGTEIAISMENALLYQRTKKFNIELKDKVNKATKKLQEQNEELQKVNRIKNEFISVTSHQLKTPLATTKLNLEIFGLKFQKQIPAEANTMVENLTNTNNQLIKLVEELLDIARIEDSRLKIDIEPLDIVAMVKQMVAEFKPLADKRSIKVVEDYEVIPPLNFDRNILSKGIANFVSNGIKYNREKKNLWVSVKSNAEGVLIAVKDEGIGVPEAEKPKIFQKFYQATNAAAASFESSTGLGLYITRTSIETLGGKVWFEAEENKGSTFFIQLPPKVKVQNQ
jgi:signal transduction histidine kinase